MRAEVASVFALVVVGCTVQPLALEDRRCPCIEGWVCNAEDLCVPSLDAGAGDAAMDAEGADTTVAQVDSAIDGIGDASDSGAPDADAPDSGPPDAGLDDTACDESLAGAFFCDGFEDTAFAAWDGTVEADGVVGVESSVVYRGAGALRGETSAPRGRAAAQTTFAPIDSGELWVRGYFYVPSTFSLSSISFLYIYENADPYDGFSVNARTGGDVSVYVAPDTFETSGALPFDRWFCLQARLVVADTGGSLETWIDGVPAASVTGVDTLPANPLTAAIIGLERAGASQPTAVAYADEVALGTSMLPCD